VSLFQGFSLAQDTSEDILHIGPLGILKYKWIDTLNIVGRAQVLPILARLSTRGISIRKTEVGLYIYRAGGLVGKDYKLLAQLMPFLIAILHHHGLVDDELARVWYSIGRLFPLLYVQRAGNLSEYQVRLESIPVLRRYILILSISGSRNFDPRSIPCSSCASSKIRSMFSPKSSITS